MTSSAAMSMRSRASGLRRCGNAASQRSNLIYVTKNSETRGRYQIGSERKLAAVDVDLGFDAVRSLSRGGRGLIRITTQKDPPGHLTRPHPAELELVSEPDTHAISWTFRPATTNEETGNAFRPTTLIDRVREH